jgi:hypothetical protein
VAGEGVLGTGGKSFDNVEVLAFLPGVTVSIEDAKTRTVRAYMYKCI